VPFGLLFEKGYENINLVSLCQLNRKMVINLSSSGAIVALFEGNYGCLFVQY